MKRVFRNLCMLICGALIFCLAACSTGSNPGISQEDGYIEGGTHILNYERTNDFIINGSSTDYKIVISDSPSEETLFAVKELQYFMREATGVTIPLIYDSGVTASADSKYIVIGENDLSDAAGIEYDYNELGNDGYLIKTIGKNIYMGGTTGNADTFAVYEFLRTTINYAYYTVQGIEFDKTRVVFLYDYDVKDVPDFALRIAGIGGWQSGSSAYTTEAIRRYRNNLTDEMFLHPPELNGYGHFHNTTFWIQPSVYAEDHPDWFSENQDELCYNVHNNPEEYQALIDEFIARIFEASLKWPSYNNVNITHNDYGYRCHCQYCTAEFEKYNNSAAGSIIQFMNDLEEQLNEAVKTNTLGIDQNKVYTIQFFAYSFAITPPLEMGVDSDGLATYLTDENGEYIPIDDTVICNENVIPWYAPLRADHTVGLDEEGNEEFYRAYQAWHALSDQIDVWIYGDSFKDPISPYPGIGGFVENARLFKKSGSARLILYEQSARGSDTAFYRAQGYVASQIAWNVNLNVEELLDNFFRVVYGPAAAPMREFYDSMFSYLLSSMETRLIESGVYGISPNNKNLWTYSVLSRWMKYVEESYASIEPLKYTDADLYQRYYDEITNESLFVRYQLYNLYPGEFSDSDYNEGRIALIEDMDRICDSVNTGYRGWENYIGQWRSELM